MINYIINKAGDYSLPSIIGRGWWWVFLFLFSFSSIAAQEKIINPDITYAGSPRTCTIAGLAVSGVEGYEDYVLTGISGLTGLFSKVAITADSLIGDKIYLHIHLAVRPRVSTINYIGLKKSEREDMEQKLGLLKGNQITPNMIDRAKILAKKYFDDKGYNNAEISIVQRDDVANKNQVILDVAQSIRRTR